MEQLGKIIKELRLSKELTLDGLGKLIGTSDTAIINWEKGINEPKATYIKELANIFNVSSDYILGIEDEFGNSTKQNKNYLANKKNSIIIYDNNDNSYKFNLNKEQIQAIKTILNSIKK